MAQLVNMKQRIKAVETIKKITNAMRLISMSAHNKLKNKKSNLDSYVNTLNSITSIVGKSIQQSQLVIPKNNSSTQKHANLIIIIGSEKGLSGNFNTQLFKFIASTILDSKHNKYIGIGTHAVKYLHRQNIKTIKEYTSFNHNNFLDIADDISSIILNNLNKFNRISSYSNKPKSFFIQEPTETIIFPYSISSKYNTSNNIDEYIWEQNPQDLYAQLQKLQINTSLQKILFESLLAEQAARFISMDSSTRNAESLLNKMKIEYNKARQATITKELIELTGGFI